MALIDISRSISSATAVWPGDQQVEWKWTARLRQEDAAVNLGSIQLSTHTASHVDAPYHVKEDGRKTDELPLPVFVGPVEVVDVQGVSRIRPENVEGVEAERVLFKTSASTVPDEQWPASITPLAPEAVYQLNDRGTLLVGTDAPSVDPLDSTSLPAHHALIDSEIVNLEGLCLEGVSPGEYYLMAFPMKLADADAAPVRAILSDSEPEGL